MEQNEHSKETSNHANVLLDELLLLATELRGFFEDYREFLQMMTEQNKALLEAQKAVEEQEGD